MASLYLGTILANRQFGCARLESTVTLFVYEYYRVPDVLNVLPTSGSPMECPFEEFPGYFKSIFPRQKFQYATLSSTSYKTFFNIGSNSAIEFSERETSINIIMRELLSVFLLVSSKFKYYTFPALSCIHYTVYVYITCMCATYMRVRVRKYVRAFKD